MVESVFAPVRAASTFEETVERLGTAIRTGILAAGSRLPAERMLADELRISRSTLRQALTTLVQSGHLVSLRGRGGGTFVTERPPLAETSAMPLGAEAWAVLDYRVAIGTGATMLAGERADTDDLDRFDTLVERMTEVTDFSIYRRADIRFHIGLAEAARSPRLVSAMTEVQGADERADHSDRAPARGVTHSNDQHRQLVRRLRRGRGAPGRSAHPRAHRRDRAHPGRASVTDQRVAARSTKLRHCACAAARH